MLFDEISNSIIEYDTNYGTSLKHLKNVTFKSNEYFIVSDEWMAYFEKITEGKKIKTVTHLYNIRG